MTIDALPPKPFAAHPALRWLRRRPHEAAGSLAVAIAVLGGSLAITEAGSTPRLPSPEERALVVAPAVEAVNPFQVRAIAPGKAVAINAAMPIADGPNPAARPFKAPPVSSLAYRRALECLTQAVYYEAALEPEDGQRAVAQVVLNRARHPAYPASVCAVVYQGHERETGCQFSFTCDGALARAPMRVYWDKVRKIAHQALQGYVHAPVGNATHYHANYVVPYWASTLTKNAVVGRHIFYRWRGGWGQPAAFAQRYSGKEADPYALRSAALTAEASYAAAALRKPGLTDEEGVVTANLLKELPPELAGLVEAELGPGGQRVTMRVPAGSQPKPDPQAELPPASPNLSWTLNGVDPRGTEQKPLGSPAPGIPKDAKAGDPVVGS